MSHGWCVRSLMNMKSNIVYVKNPKYECTRLQTGFTKPFGLLYICNIYIFSAELLQLAWLDMFEIRWGATGHLCDLNMCELTTWLWCFACRKFLFGHCLFLEAESQNLCWLDSWNFAQCGRELSAQSLQNTFKTIMWLGKVEVQL